MFYIAVFATTSSVGGPQASVTGLSRFSSVPGKTASLPPGMKLSSLSGKRAPGLQRLASISEKSSYQFILRSQDDLSRNGGGSVSSPKHQQLHSLKRQDSFHMRAVMEPQEFTDNVSVKSAEKSDTAQEGANTSQVCKNKNIRVGAYLCVCRRCSQEELKAG